MSANQAKRHAILAYMQNRPGVLNKVSMLIRRKMYNIDTITICESRRPGISRMTMTLCEEDERKVAQVVKQIAKIPEVIEAKSLETENSFWREVAIIKFNADPDLVKRLAHTYEFEILDHQLSGRYIVQLAGPHQWIDNFVTDLGNDKVLEMARSGFTALEK